AVSRRATAAGVGCVGNDCAAATGVAELTLVVLVAAGARHRATRYEPPAIAASMAAASNQWTGTGRCWSFCSSVLPALCRSDASLASRLGVVTTSAVDSNWPRYC